MLGSFRTLTTQMGMGAPRQISAAFLDKPARLQVALDQANIEQPWTQESSVILKSRTQENLRMLKNSLKRWGGKGTQLTSVI